MPLATKQKLGRTIPLGQQRRLDLSVTLVMGVLNVTPDSFSDGGRFEDPGTAVNRAIEMEQQGADIIDIGGESSRPGASPVSTEQEWARIGPVIEGIRSRSKVAISVDTCKSGVAKAALDAGADIINDISALRDDPGMGELAASRQVPVVLMHMLGTPATMQKDPTYDDCVSEINEFFCERVEVCHRLGIDSSRIILDPGIGFGKRVSDNLDILARLSEFKQLGLPLLVGTSRKSFIGKLHPSEGPASNRLGGSIASMVMAVANGADIVRVHDVAETVEALKIVRAIKEGV